MSSGWGDEFLAPAGTAAMPPWRRRTAARRGGLEPEAAAKSP